MPPAISTVMFKPFHIQILSFVSLAAGKALSGKQLLGINELVMVSVFLEGCCAASFFFIKTSWPTVAVVSNSMIKAGFKSPSPNRAPGAAWLPAVDLRLPVALRQTAQELFHRQLLLGRQETSLASVPWSLLHVLSC